jgi:DNA-directed RNA polymerase sigma subunit (sigma70/sigma32)
VRVESPFDDDRRALHFEPECRFAYRSLPGYEKVVLLQTAMEAAAASEELTAGELPEAARHELQRLVERGTRAKSQLAAAHLWHAEYYARRLAASRRGRRHEVDDLMQEALLGLLWTIDNFKPESGVGFDNLVEHMMQRAAMRPLARPRPRAEDANSIAV